MTKQSLFAGKDGFAAQKQNAQPAPHPLDSRLRGNDENDTPVIPGEHRATRNPGAPCFCPLDERPALWDTRNDTQPLGHAVEVLSHSP